MILKANSLPAIIENDDERIKKLVPPYKVQLRAKSKDLLIEEEVQRRK